MRLLCCFSLFVVAVFKSCAQPISEMADAKAIACDIGGDNFPASRIPPTKDTTWTHNYIYPIKVCATGKGMDNVNKCTAHERSSHVTLEVLSAGAKDPLNINFNFSNSAITSSPLCHIFKVSDIVAPMEGKGVAGSKWGGHAIIFGDKKVATTESTVQVSVRAAPYYFDKPGTLSAIKDDHKDHAVVCNFKNCKIDATGAATAPITERFNVIAGKAPTLAKAEGLLADNMFSVHLYECKPRCPTSFTASRIASAPGFNALYQLSIGTVLAVAVSLLDA